MFNSIKNRYCIVCNAKVFLFSISIFILSFTAQTIEQYTSNNHYSGFWGDTLSWSGDSAPGISVLKGNVFCYGEITSLNCLEFNQSILTVYDTLIINGDLEFKNTSALTVESGGLLIVFGDYTSGNKTEVVNRGTIAVSGNFEMLGAGSQGSFLNEGDLFIFDETPLIKEGTNYTTIMCEVVGDDSICGYGGYDDFVGTGTYTYYQSLPYSNREIDPDDNPCSKFSIVQKGKLCTGTGLSFFLDAVGLGHSDTIHWDFGDGATPIEAYGIGPHTVQFDGQGDKIIEVQINGNIDTTVQDTFDIEAIPEAISINNHGLGTYQEEVCRDSTVNYQTTGNTGNTYLWEVPALGIDTAAGFSLDVQWGISTGDYEISVTEKSGAGCLGDKVTNSVLVENCEEGQPDQYTTINNITGYYGDMHSWVGNNAPGISVLKSNVFCFGEITSLNCLEFNQSILTVYDTLIINGDILFSNTSTLTVESGGLLIVFGDYTSGNKTEVVNRGTIAVSGNFEMLGAGSQGSFLNEGDLFIFDETPLIKEGTNYTTIMCEVVGDDTICGYGGYDDFVGTGTYTYYQSLPYSNREIDPDDNPCSKYSIVQKGKLCPGTGLSFFLDAVGIGHSDTIHWDFGDGSIPDEAYGIGPHTVYFESPGEKNVGLQISGTNDLTIKSVYRIEDIPLPISIINEKNEVPPGYFLDEVCENTVSEYRTNGSVESQFIWKVPNLNIDTVTDYFISFSWDLPPGEYPISVIEQNASGCLGEEVSDVVLVKVCDDTDLFEKENYAFTPNGDGINDFWIVPGIEDYPMAKIYVFNRKGEPLFKSEGNYQNDWDGTSGGSKLTIGSYYYIIDLSAYNKPEERGVITIIW